jgi:hypothetical protein
MIAESICKEYKKQNVSIVVRCLYLKLPLTYVLHVLNQAMVKEVMRELVAAAVVTAIKFFYMQGHYNKIYDIEEITECTFPFI